MEVAPNHVVRVFAQINRAQLPGACPGGIGLTTALAILPGDFVVVGSLPTTGGDPVTSTATWWRPRSSGLGSQSRSWTRPVPRAEPVRCSAWR